MTPYGALPVKNREPADMPYACACPYCEEYGPHLWQDDVLLSHHNLWMILHVLNNVTQRRAAGTLEPYLEQVVDIHQQWFPDSLLQRSWETLNSE